MKIIKIIKMSSLQELVINQILNEKFKSLTTIENLSTDLLEQQALKKTFEEKTKYMKINCYALMMLEKIDDNITHLEICWYNKSIIPISLNKLPKKLKYLKIINIDNNDNNDFFARIIIQENFEFPDTLIYFKMDGFFENIKNYEKLIELPNLLYFSSYNIK